LQGWAIVDNDSDTDWNGVELSLITGGPDSFIQNLYKPYHVARRTIPLVIESGAEASNRSPAPMPFEEPAGIRNESVMAMNAAVPQADLTGSGGLATPRGQDAAEQFEYKFPTPVTIARQQSVMIPLVESIVQASKTLLFANAVANETTHPSLAVEIINTTGNKLPAGAVTVYDGGTYAGDAFISKFFPMRERQYLSYGKDLSVSGGMKQGTPPLPFTTSVEIGQGTLIITRTTEYKTSYTFKNSGTEAKVVVVEHPINAGRKLRSASANEVNAPSYWQYWRNDNAHYFSLPLPLDREATLLIEETRDEPRRLFMSALSFNELRNHATNVEFSQRARDALKRPLDLLQKVEDANTALKQLQQQQQQIRANQTNIRANITAVGRDTDAGKPYVQQLQAEETKLSALATQITDAETAIKSARDAYNMEIAALTFKD
jgi:hypothetical protein